MTDIFNQALIDWLIDRILCWKSFYISIDIKIYRYIERTQEVFLNFKFLKVSIMFCDYQYFG